MYSMTSVLEYWINFWIRCFLHLLFGQWHKAGDPSNPQDLIMKDSIHPEYREVVFLDQQTGSKIISRSTLNSRETIELDGKTYPLFKCDVTAESHPFYTGAQTRIVETGRVEKFRARFATTAGTRKKAS
jgi:large subunit ribosomal protein L31